MLEAKTPEGWAWRSAAASDWERLGWPTTKLESWRYFSTRSLENLDLARAPETRVVEVGDLPSPRIVFIDGRFAPHLLELGELASHIELRALSYYDDAQVMALLDKQTDKEAGLERVNSALLTDGLHLKVKKNAALGLLHLVHLTTNSGVVHARHIIELERHAELSLLVEHRGLTEDAYLHSLVSEIRLGEGAQLSLGKCVAEGPNGNHIESSHIEVGRDAKLKSFVLTLSGERARTQAIASLVAPGAEASIDGLYLGDGKSVFDHVSEIRHVVGQTTSSETWAGVLDGKSTGNFQGMVRIAEGAAKSATQQLTRTLLLSEGAQANAKPELRIDCDDVTASHGATIGQLDPVQRFYLQSRGITPDEAQRFLILAFVAEVIALAPENMREALRSLVEIRLDAPRDLALED